MKPSSISINATNLAITELSENFSFNSIENPPPMKKIFGFSDLKAGNISNFINNKIFSLLLVLKR